jgi:hypothetical protein
MKNKPAKYSSLVKRLELLASGAAWRPEEQIVAEILQEAADAIRALEAKR